MASLIPLLKKELSMLAQLGRLRMTIFSAVTYSTAFSMALHYEFGSKLDSIPFQTGTFLLGWAFILFCQLSAHFLGEYYDFKSDVLNRNASPFTGGSRVLVNGGYSPQRCLFLGWFSCISSFLILQWQLPNTVHLVGYVMIFLACQYSGAPLRFSHHALGELNAALVMNIFLPYFAAVLANPSFYGSFDLRLAMLIIPSALLKFALFIVLNMADRRADWLGGKITLPVLLGDDTSARLYTFLVVSAYVSIPAIYLLDPNNTVATLSTALLMLSSAYPVVPLCKSLLHNRPYYITGLVRQCLQHSPLPVLAVYLDCLGKELLVSDSPLVHLLSIGFQVRCLPVYPYLFMLLKKPPQVAPSPPQLPQHPILISGGGIAGLVLASTLFKLKIPYIILEKKSKSTVDDGADLAFWPSSIKILKELGIDQKLWENSLPISQVHLAKSSTDILNTVNMDRVTLGTGEHFRLVARHDLMTCLQHLQENSQNILYNCKITKIEEMSDCVRVIYSENGLEKSIVGHVLVGADGVNSVSRHFITASSALPRYTGEICFRGTTSSPHLANLAEAPNTMTIWYGNGYRASWGLISPTKSYWWVKVKAKDENLAKELISGLPAPINEFAANSSYVHPIIDRMSSDRWCSSRCVLVGDAAHPVTPNMAQGANMAIEDAFFLGICLKKFYFQDGFQEAFYTYFFKRWPYTKKIAQESYQQSRMGQWTNPLMVRLREIMLRNVPAKVLEKKLRNVNLCDVTSWLEDFRDLSKKEK